jgi:hypothetical protein
MTDVLYPFVEAGTKGRDSKNENAMRHPAMMKQRSKFFSRI